jgi:type IV secretion system protein VirD4
MQKGLAPNSADLFDQSMALLAVNIWGLTAELIFGVILLNILQQRNSPRLIWGGMFFSIMLGRLVTGFPAAMLAYAAVPKLLLFVLAPFMMWVGGIIVILTFVFIIGAIAGFFIAMPVMIFNQIFAFERALNVFRYQKKGLASYIVRAMRWLRDEPEPIAGPDDSKGARFATHEEAVARHNADNKRPGKMAFGHWISDKIPLYLHTDKHILIMASTRSGKGVTLIIPHLLRYSGSAFVLDPKGENAKATGRQRAVINQTVHYLDPFGISGKPQSRFNPLSRFTAENMEAESKALAAALFVVGERERDHWTAAGQQLLAAVILYVYVSNDIGRSRKDLATVRRILLGGVKDALNAMTQIDEADGLLRDLAVSFLDTPEKEFGSIVSTTQRQTEILDNPFMIACLSASGPGPEVDFKQWHSGTMTVYLCLSAPKFPTFNRWLRLVLTSALDEMTDSLNPPPLPVCFMLDELATLGHLATVENAIGLAAGYGVQLVCIFQDVAQMRDLYKGRWASFIGNAGVRALFNLDDYDTASYWSKFIGGQLVETRSTKQDVYGMSDGDTSISETMRPLLSPDKIMMDFASGKMLVLAQGTHPIITQRVAYFNDPSLAKVWDDPRAPGKTTPTPPMPPSSAPPASPKPPSWSPSGPTPQTYTYPLIRIFGENISENLQGMSTPAAPKDAAPKTTTMPKPIQFKMPSRAEIEALKAGKKIITPIKRSPKQTGKDKARDDDNNSRS